MSVSGYHEQFLHVDVTDGAAELRCLPEDQLRKFIGGSGLGTSMLLDLNKATADALSPESPLVLAFSPFIGTPLTTSARFAVVSKSPLTNRLNDALCGSRFAIAGKSLGVDAIAITGRCEAPSILVIDALDSKRGSLPQVQLIKAADVWGLEIDAAERLLSKRYGTGFASLLIGPAGENLVRYATLAHDGRHAGRGGSGAVLGSKQIKAVLVRGCHRSTWHDTDALVSRARSWSSLAQGPATAKYREIGTTANLLTLDRLGALPSKNFQANRFEASEGLLGQSVRPTSGRVRQGCAACNIGCEHYFTIDDQSSKTVRLEYESLFALGPMCGIDDRNAVLRATQRCDQLGLDTISAGGTLAFAMECREHSWCDSSFPRFGDGTALVDMLDNIAMRKGAGDLLAEGSLRVAHQLGHDSIGFAPQVKGLELPGYDPRTLHMMALGLAVGARGADHNRSSAYEIDLSSGPLGKPFNDTTIREAIAVEDRAAMLDSLILCKFVRHVFDDFHAEAASAVHEVTGWDFNANEMRLAGQRILTAKKQYNIRAGWTSEEDVLPARLFGEGSTQNESIAKTKSKALDHDQLNDAILAYYSLRGWDTRGIPTEETLTRLGLLSDSADEIHAGFPDDSDEGSPTV